eukprot:jgi/Mesvir1/26571/Mv16225-RA.1
MRSHARRNREEAIGYPLTPLEQLADVAAAAAPKRQRALVKRKTCDELAGTYPPSDELRRRWYRGQCKGVRNGMIEMWRATGGTDFPAELNPLEPMKRKAGAAKRQRKGRSTKSCAELKYSALRRRFRAGKCGDMTQEQYSALLSRLRPKRKKTVGASKMDGDACEKLTDLGLRRKYAKGECLKFREGLIEVYGDQHPRTMMPRVRKPRDAASAAARLADKAERSGYARAQGGVPPTYRALREWMKSQGMSRIPRKKRVAPRRAPPAAAAGSGLKNCRELTGTALKRAWMAQRCGGDYTRADFLAAMNKAGQARADNRPMRPLPAAAPRKTRKSKNRFGYEADFIDDTEAVDDKRTMDTIRDAVRRQMMSQRRSENMNLAARIRGPRMD